MRRPEIGAVEERLHADYSERFFAAGATGFDTWGNGAKIGIEARFREGFGPVFGPAVRYARLPGWLGLFGPLVPFRSLEDAERELRQEIEDYLAKLQAGHKPRIFGP
jgi:hypothetical protein